MSEYSDSSLLLLPSGVKEGKLYVQKPTDRLSDFTVNRASFATRVNKDGIIEEVGDDIARIDYTDGGCGVLLTEPQSTNLAKWSEDFSNVAWGNTEDTTINSDTTISPDGTQNADEVVPDNVSNFHRIQQISTVTIGLDYSYTVFAKYKGNDFFIFRSNIGSGGGRNTCFNINTGVIEYDGIGNAKIEAVADGWYRLSMGFNALGTTGSSSFYSSSPNIVPDDNITAFTGDGFSGAYVWGYQLEQLSYPTSYIKTEGSTVTRLGDEITNGGTVNDFNSEEGVLFCEIAGLVVAADGVTREIAISDGTSSNRVELRYGTTSNAIQYLIRIGGSIQTNQTGIVSDITNFNKVALTWKLNEFKLFINGIQIGVTDTSGNVFSAGSLNTIELKDGGGGSPFYGKTKQIKVYKTALSDAELILLTTP